MPKIHVLDKHTAELIAAGEVVERPASVAKELVENAIDAGAHVIEVEISGGGIRRLEIRDDGCGIAPEDMPAAFIRHATSKIAAAEDLEAIHTLGFRGEALASVASVAKVMLVSRAPGEENAWCYTIAGGQELSLQEDARAQGTTITVCDLFYNTPARMKFLKKETSEATYVQDAVEHLALSHPEISFRFVREGKEQFFTPGDGALHSAACALLGRETAREMTPVDYEQDGLRVTGLVTPPRAARASRSMQHFYVNGRYVKSRTMMAATENAFRGLLMGGRFPGCVLMLQLPPQAVDVNVHPAKTEVRFAHENDVFNAVYRAVKAAVMRPQSLENPLSLENAAKKRPAAPQGVQIAFSAEDLSRPAKAPAADGVQAQKTVFVTSGEDAAAHGDKTPDGRPDPDPAAGTVKTENTRPSTTDTVEAAAPRKTAGGLLAPDAPLYGEMSQAATRQVEDSMRGPLPMEEDAAGSAGFFRACPAGLDITVEEDAAAQDVSAQGTHIGDAPTLDAPGCGTSLSAQDAHTGDMPAQDAPAAAATDISGSAPDVSVPSETADAFGHAEIARTLDTSIVSTPSDTPAPGEALTLVGEVFKTYILAQRGEELCIIDKHAAHERLLYEKLLQNYGDVAGQLLLAPAAVELSAAEKTALLDQQQYLAGIGIAVEDFGGRTVLVREVPADIRVENAAALVQEIAAKLAEGAHQPLPEKTAWVLHSIACRAAVKGGDTSHAPELLALARDILDGVVPPFCPHGRPVVLRLTRKDLEKQFGRLG